MNAKGETQVMLKCESLGIDTQAFAFSHAERLLSMPLGGGWGLNDNNFEYSVENGLKRRKNKGGARKVE